jgi:hypothetical protein
LNLNFETWKLGFQVSSFINWMLKYENQCIDKQANHQHLGIQVISSIGSSLPCLSRICNINHRNLYYSDILKYGFNKCNLTNVGTIIYWQCS